MVEKVAYVLLKQLNIWFFGATHPLSWLLPISGLTLEAGKATVVIQETQEEKTRV